MYLSSKIEEKIYLVKLDAIVVYIDNRVEEFKDIDVVRQEENYIILLKDRISDVDFFRISIQLPLENIKKFQTTIQEIKEIE